MTKLAAAEIADVGLPPNAAWWIGAAGTREQGSERDFYASIETEAVRHGKGTGAPSTKHLLPKQIDKKRIEAEIAARAVLAVQELVLNLIAKSLQDGKPYTVELQEHRITVLVRASSASEAYLAISAEGFVRPEMIAIILQSVPGIPRDDWQPEPGGVAGVTPQSGQVIWSTIISPDIQAEILQRFDSEE